MGRVVASNVSALSGCVANRDQTMHHDSCSPSKIPYGGFSPVRLQTGVQLQPSSTVRRVKCKVHIRRVSVNLYAATAAISGTYGPCGQDRRHPLIPAFQSRGPWLAAGLCCPRRSMLTMASSETLVPTTALSSSSSHLYPTTLYGRVTRASPIYSVCLSLRAVFRTPAFRVAAGDCCFTTRTGLIHLRNVLAPACPRHRFSRKWRNEAAKFALCYGPQSCSPFTDKGLLLSSFHFKSRLQEMSNITTRAHSQFP